MGERKGPTCGAKSRAGTPCTQRAGWGTDHPGTGRCKLHGGASRGGGRPIIHGRYSKLNHERLAERIAKFAADPDPLDLLPELALLRALVSDYVERYEAFTAALVAWHESYRVVGENSPEPKPRQVIDILAVGKFISDIGNLTERVQKQRAEGSISMVEMNRILEQMGAEVVKAAQEALPDADQRATVVATVERRWGGIALDPRGAPRA